MPIFFSRFLSPLPIDVRLAETHEVSVGITEIPLEDGSAVNDHAYIKPANLKIEFASGMPALSWQQLERQTKARQPFTIVTGLDVYENMILKLATAVVDKSNSKILRGTVELQEVLIAGTSYGYAVPGGGGGGLTGAAGAPGGGGSIRAATPAPGIVSADAADVASPVVLRGDTPTADVPAGNTQSLLYGLVN